MNSLLNSSKVNGCSEEVLGRLNIEQLQSSEHKEEGQHQRIEDHVECVRVQVLVDAASRVRVAAVEAGANGASQGLIQSMSLLQADELAIEVAWLAGANETHHGLGSLLHNARFQSLVQFVQ
eukprot:CAMPEP_0202955808 /NCGR_PEP_ID=MMETSP1396-20130829/323_1 /ASSEMBLY_ACC=CAM_ASM_000872 /TAXON_ID= /ORGANISM="Pseudokeronopsis sp., Strain Brazil" /LENGTH=121 /DNA_ID=CAMNT_0049672515 /DNA_START=30 /DNA_END=395 /DNA_ORIENTATION=-